MANDGNIGCLLYALSELLDRAAIFDPSWWTAGRAKVGDYADALEPIAVGGSGKVLIHDQQVRARNVGSRAIEAHRPCRVTRRVGRFLLVSADPKEPT